MDKMEHDYSHIAEITSSLRIDLANARERLAALEAHVFKAHVKEMEGLGKRIDRLSENLKLVRNIQWLVIVAILTNLAAIVFKNN